MLRTCIGGWPGYCCPIIIQCYQLFNALGSSDDTHASIESDTCTGNIIDDLDNDAGVDFDDDDFDPNFGHHDPIDFDDDDDFDDDGADFQDVDEDISDLENESDVGDDEDDQMEDCDSVTLLSFILTIFFRIIHHFNISSNAASKLIAFISFVLGTILSAY